MNMGIERSVELPSWYVLNVLVGLALLLLKLKYLCYKGFMECLNFKLILWFCRIWLCCTLLHHHSGAYMFTCILSVNFEAKLILCMSINLYLWSIVLSSLSVLLYRCSTILVLVKKYTSMNLCQILNAWFLWWLEA